MDAYAVTAAFDANFASHDWAVANVKGAGLEDDFSTVWPNSKDEDLCLDTVDDVVYFYGGRGAIYKALAHFDQSRIRNFAGGHRLKDEIDRRAPAHQVERGGDMRQHARLGGDIELHADIVQH